MIRAKIVSNRLAKLTKEKGSVSGDFAISLDPESGYMTRIQSLQGQRHEFIRSSSAMYRRRDYVAALDLVNIIQISFGLIGGGHCES
jgi:hypothetical protein